MATPGVDWAKVDYNNPKQLEQTLQGVHTLLSFIVIQDGPASAAQKNLIDAAVLAGVKRFAPSEWATSVIQPPKYYAIIDPVQIQFGIYALVRLQGRNSAIPRRVE